ncbi:fungal-specific transcription factor domain-containing protein [Mariannaea sp. PMI_226]|nr:fungal-specific transcription factor domain-containing protein [Mariannaea sp. PMI_226]
MSTRLRSRNGCATCKGKRQKCDETRPSCMRCQRARIPCAGYPKAELRWRTVNKIKTSPDPIAKSNAQSRIRFSHDDSATRFERQLISTEDCYHNTCAGKLSPDSDSIASAELSVTTLGDGNSATSEPCVDECPVTQEPDFPLDIYLFNLSDAAEGIEQFDHQVDDKSSEANHNQLEISMALGPWIPQDVAFEPAEFNTIDSWTPSPVQLRPSNSASGMLRIYFDQQTCGILSIKDGPTDNPWRTLILPLSQESRAVSHAISCMAAFHCSYDIPNMYTEGTEDMEESNKWLMIEREKRIVPSLAASVALVFAEGWKFPKSITNRHLDNARQLIKERFPTEQELFHLTSPNAARLKYLITTFVYLHVISGITRRKEEKAHHLPEKVLSFLDPILSGTTHEIDPLLGCATSLFPLVDGVMCLVSRVRKVQRNSLTLVSQASELYVQLQQWQAPNLDALESFGEPLFSLQHSIQTAEALRYAALLHLHQAVPEIHSLASEELARKVLLKLASIPSISRMTNLHIFPLLAASCELKDEEDREWAKQRWEAMISRLRVRNVDTCWEIVQATWARRDMYVTESRSSLTEQPNSGPGDEYTIRGKLHWLNVMEDQKWQVFVG